MATARPLLPSSPISYSTSSHVHGSGVLSSPTTITRPGYSFAHARTESVGAFIVVMMTWAFIDDLGVERRSRTRQGLEERLLIVSNSSQRRRPLVRQAQSQSCQDHHVDI